MQGLELCRRYFEECALPLLQSDFPELLENAAFGLVGEGSECLMLDDGISRDHDFEPGFCIWLTESAMKEHELDYRRFYNSLPKEFMGFKKSVMSPAGGKRHGVLGIDEFYSRLLGAGDWETENPSLEQWLYLPGSAFLSCSNGEIFFDNPGVFSRLRQVLLGGYPEDLRKKRLASELINMSQSGDYNYNRCVDRGDLAAASLAAHEFVHHALSAIYLLNNAYEPYYKWVFRGMEKLAFLWDLKDILESIAINPTVDFDDKKERVCTAVTAELTAQGLINREKTLEKQAFAVQEKIKGTDVRNMGIML